jgi:hypothetical protein
VRPGSPSVVRGLGDIACPTTESTGSGRCGQSAGRDFGGQIFSLQIRRSKIDFKIKLLKKEVKGIKCITMITNNKTLQGGKLLINQ